MGLTSTPKSKISFLIKKLNKNIFAFCIPKVFFTASSLLLCVHPLSSAQTPSRRNIRIQVEFLTSSVSSQLESGYREQEQGRRTQFLVLAEGYEGRIEVGDRLPYIKRMQHYLLEEGYVDEEVDFLELGTRLLVRASFEGDLIEVDLIPEISYLSRDGRGSISVTSLSTRVLVADGQTMTIGGSIQENEFLNDFYSTRSGSRVEIKLTPSSL